MGFGSVWDAAGNPLKNPVFSKLWFCPSKPPINLSSVFVLYPQGRHGSTQIPANAIQSNNYPLELPYMYCGFGQANEQTFNQDPFHVPADGSSSYVKVPLPIRSNEDQVKVLFADRVQWHYQLGFSSNHPITVHPGTYGNPTIDGQNEGFSDGHGEWVDRQGVPLLNAGRYEGPPAAASVPVVIFPQSSPLPAGYPSAINQGGYPFYGMWYW